MAAKLREAAGLLQAQGASAYRVHAYRDAAQAIEPYARDVRAVYAADGVKGLDAIPRVGLGIASAVAEILVRGRWSMLDRLRGQSDPAALLQMVPGVGPKLAQLIHERPHADSLERLEEAACDGRLASLPGVGSRRAASIRASLGEMLGRQQEPRERARGKSEPDIGTLLSVDREYRRRASHGELRLIAPRRLNPDSIAWLPVMHVMRGPWQFTVLYSNTATAHRLGRIHDWVVVYFYDGDHVERSRTVVTEHRGPLAGHRVVRGRESECVELLGGRDYADHTNNAAKYPPFPLAAGANPEAARAP